MRILAPEHVLFTGQHLCPEFDCHLCLLIGLNGGDFCKQS